MKKESIPIQHLENQSSPIEAVDDNCIDDVFFKDGILDNSILKESSPLHRPLGCEEKEDFDPLKTLN